MEKDLETEKERDRQRATRFLEPKFSITSMLNTTTLHEPPPKVQKALLMIYSSACLDPHISLGFLSAFIAVYLYVYAALKTEPWSFWEYPQHRSAHSGIVGIHMHNLN